MRRILITGVGGDVACAIIRCLKDSFAGDEIYGMDIKEFTPYMDELTKTIRAPRYTDKEYTPFLKRTIMENNITHFLPTAEPEIMVAAENRSFFEEHGVRLIINSDEIIKTCTSKYKTAAFLKSIGVDAPATYPASGYKGELGYPFIMKADSGSGSKKLKIVENEEQWFNADKENMICQQMVGDTDSEYTIGVFSDGIIVRSIVLRRYLGYGGMSVEVHCCENPEMNRIAEKIAGGFHLRGCINVQLRRHGDRCYVFEINPRLSSTVGFRHKMGFQDAAWWFEISDGEEVPIYRNDAVGKVGVKVTDDIILTQNSTGGGNVLTRHYTGAVERQVYAA